MMNRPFRVIFLIVALFLLLLISAGIRVMVVNATQSADYTEDDWLEYKILTRDEVKNAPRISPDFLFKFRQHDGPSPQLSVIEFYHTQESERLEKYLASLGYYSGMDPLFGKVWYAPDNRSSAYIKKFDKRTVTLTVTDVPAPLNMPKDKNRTKN